MLARVNDVSSLQLLNEYPILALTFELVNLGHLIVSNVNQGNSIRALDYESALSDGRFFSPQYC
jgi:hypothetical protein